MSDNMQPFDETLDDESLDAVDAEATEDCEDVEEFDPFEGMSDEELDALCDEDESLAGFGDVEPGFRSGFVAWSAVPTPVSPRCSTPAMAKRLPSPRRWPRPPAVACAPSSIAPATSWSLSIPRVFTSPRTAWVRAQQERAVRAERCRCRRVFD